MNFKLFLKIIRLIKEFKHVKVLIIKSIYLVEKLKKIIIICKGEQAKSIMTSSGATLSSHTLIRF